MCLIVDSNIVHKVFQTQDEDFLPVNEALSNGRAKMVYGGKLTDEYRRISWFRRVLLQLDRQGAARKFPDSKIESQTELLRGSALCVSDDHHILALAMVSGVRLLCSEDEDLGNDFTNHRLLSRPRGKIYKRAEHHPLIREYCDNR